MNSTAIPQKLAIATSIMPVLVTVNGKITTTSQQIADHFGKRHTNVLRAIKSMDLPSEYHKLNFEPMIVEVETGKGATRKDPAYRLTRDGFALLAMGFTGKEAMHWKLAYLEAFNKMEEELYPTLSTTLTLSQQQQLKAAVQTVCKNDPKAYSQLYKALYARFGVPKYQDLRQADFVDAVGFVGNYQVQTIEPVPTLLNRRWLMAYDHTGKEQLQSVPSNACVAAPEEWAKMIREAGGLFLEPQTLADIATACTERLARQSASYMQSTKELRLKLQSH